jgi:hypothetical protein
MISHKYKCIFIHIPRCAGTSMEVSIHGGPYKKDGHKYKHLTSAYAKILYKDYWADYFKFSFVRNPWDRIFSLTKFPNFYGCEMKDGQVNIKNYITKFPLMEIDPRTDCKVDHNKIVLENCIYRNILSEEIDFIGRFENIEEDWAFVSDMLKEKPPELTNFHVTKRPDYKKKKHYTEYYDDEAREIVAERYEKDIEYFGYKFGE